jgi:acyl-CoA thioesterase
MQDPDNSQIIATRSAEAMMKGDHAAHMLGIKLAIVKPGFAEMTMVVREDMLNGHGICHGGIIFSLADTAFAYACNSRNEKTVALNCVINYCASASMGDSLTALAQERSLSRRTGVYDVEIQNQRAQTIAFFRGTSYKTSAAVYSG